MTGTGDWTWLPFLLFVFESSGFVRILGSRVFGSRGVGSDLGRINLGVSTTGSGNFCSAWFLGNPLSSLVEFSASLFLFAFAVSIFSKTFALRTSRSVCNVSLRIRRASASACFLASPTISRCSLASSRLAAAFGIPFTGGPLASLIPFFARSLVLGKANFVTGLVGRVRSLEESIFAVESASNFFEPLAVYSL